MKRAAWAPAAALAAALCLGGTQATTAPTLTLEQQAKKADVIVRAVLGAPATVQDGAVTYVVYPLTDLKETVAGNPASLPQHEGKAALFFLQGLQDVPTLQAGQEVFALLYARKLDSPLVGFHQGLYPIVNGSVTLNSVMGDAARAREAAAKAATDPAATTAPAVPTAGTATPPLAPVGTLPETSAPTGTPAAAAQAQAAEVSAPGATPAGTAVPAAAPAAAPPGPGFPTDPAKFRDALRAARGNA